MNYPSQRPPRQWRVLVFRAIIIISFGLLVGRIYQLEFVQRDEYVAQAQENRTTTISIPATRGIITDRNGVPLALNVPSANVTVTPALLPDDEAEARAVLERLASLLGIPYSGELNTVDERGIPQQSLLTMVQTGQGIAPYQPVVVKSDVDDQIARLLIAEQSSFPGVNVDWVNVREYPTGSLTAHLIGYEGPIPPEDAANYEALGYVLDRDRIGYDGIEYSLEDQLAGTPGRQEVIRDVAGQVVSNVGESVPAVDGASVQLTIDVDLQQAAQNALVDEINKLKELNPNNPIGYDRGVVIAMNPRTGEVLAMVSWPTYDNTNFARGIDYNYYERVSQDPLHPLFNQAINSLYPPGSIFKVLTATAVLEEGVVTPDTIITDPGQIQLENRYYPNDPGQSQTFVCWLKSGHGNVNIIEAIAWSCDVFFYKVGGGYQNEVPGGGLGITRLGEWMQVYGLGSPTGIEIAGEQSGFIPTPDWKRRVWGENWSTGDTYNSAFGQGYVLVTPLQMITVLNTIANNGLQPRPTLIRQITDAQGRVIQPFQPDFTDIRDRIAAFWPDAHDGQQYPNTLSQTLSIVQTGMRGAVTLEGGTAIPAQRDYLPGIQIAAKTGTAEFCDNIVAALDQCNPGDWPSHAWFMTYAPYTNPEISVIAFIYNGGEGSINALPVAMNVMKAYFDLKAQRAAAGQSGQ